jgi:hypothetical protein
MDLKSLVIDMHPERLSLYNGHGDVLVHHRRVIQFLSLGSSSNDRFQHKGGIKWEILQNEITGTQTRFYTNFGGKLSFIPSFLFLSTSIAASYVFTASPVQSTINIFPLEFHINWKKIHIIIPWQFQHKLYYF